MCRLRRTSHLSQSHCPAVPGPPSCWGSIPGAVGGGLSHLWRAEHPILVKIHFPTAAEFVRCRLLPALPGPFKEEEGVPDRSSSSTSLSGPRQGFPGPSWSQPRLPGRDLQVPPTPVTSVPPPPTYCFLLSGCLFHLLEHPGPGAPAGLDNEGGPLGQQSYRGSCCSWNFS